MVSDAKTSPALDSDARQAATLAIDALSKWRNELTAANDRWLRKVLDQMSVVARALDWPDDVLNGTREHLLNASRMQSQIIDQFIDIWSGHLKSATGLKAVPPSLYRTQGTPPRGLSEPLGMKGVTFAPMDFWVQAAETWQRNWASAISLWMEALPMSHSNDDRERSRTLSGRRSN